MIVIDANVFLRALVVPPEPYNGWMHEEATSLFRQAQEGEVHLLTTGAVIAEVAFLLTSKAVYAVDVGEATGLLESLLLIPNLHVDTKMESIQALRLWANHPKLGFVDALLAVVAEESGYTLASFDSDFDRLPTLVRYEWPKSHRHDRA